MRKSLRIRKPLKCLTVNMRASASIWWSDEPHGSCSITRISISEPKKYKLQFIISFFFLSLFKNFTHCACDDNESIYLLRRKMLWILSTIVHRMDWMTDKYVWHAAPYFLSSRDRFNHNEMSAAIELQTFLQTKSSQAFISTKYAYTIQIDDHQSPYCPSNHQYMTVQRKRFTSIIF